MVKALLIPPPAILHPLLGTSQILVSLGWISCSDATNFIYFIKFSDFSRELLYQS